MNEARRLLRKAVLIASPRGFKDFSDDVNKYLNETDRATTPSERDRLAEKVFIAMVSSAPAWEEFKYMAASEAAYMFADEFLKAGE